MAQGPLCTPLLFALRAVRLDWVVRDTAWPLAFLSRSYFDRLAPSSLNSSCVPVSLGEACVKWPDNTAFLTTADSYVAPVEPSSFPTCWHCSLGYQALSCFSGAMPDAMTLRDSNGRLPSSAVSRKYHLQQLPQPGLQCLQLLTMEPPLPHRASGHSQWPVVTTLGMANTVD